MKTLLQTFFLLLIFSACQLDKTPEELIIGKYVFNESESLTLVNDSIVLMYLDINGINHCDTLKFSYRPPIYSENKVSSGDLFFESPINHHSELFKYCRTMNCDETHLYYTIRYDKYMLLPNPESTELCYELLK